MESLTFTAEFLLKGIDFIQDLPYRIMGSGNQQIISSAEFIPKPGKNILTLRNNYLVPTQSSFTKIYLLKLFVLQ